MRAYNCGFGEWNGITVAIVCIYVEDRALSVGDRVLSHQPQIQCKYSETGLLFLGYEYRHFLHKHSGNYVYISGDWKNNSKKQIIKKTVTQVNKLKKYTFGLIIIQQT